VARVAAVTWSVCRHPGRRAPTDPASLRLDIREAGRVVDAIHLDGVPVHTTYLDATTFAVLDRDAHLTVWRLR
jgi:hypothetical protein